MKALKKLRVIMAVVGCFLTYAGVSTSDYYTTELGQPDPAYIWLITAIGIALTLPALIHVIRSRGQDDSEGGQA